MYLYTTVTHIEVMEFPTFVIIGSHGRKEKLIVCSFVFTKPPFVSNLKNPLCTSHNALNSYMENFMHFESVFSAHQIYRSKNSVV